jgi:cytochrome c
MFKLDLKKVAITFGLSIFAVSSLSAKEEVVKLKTLPLEQRAIDGAVEYKIQKGEYAGTYKVNMQTQKMTPKFGRTATKNEIKAWNVDVRYDWQGLPEGKGTAEEGSDLYDSKCAMCHGDMGTGGLGYPMLVGGSKESLKNQLIDPANGDEPPIRTIGSYWPYASTLWWYVKTGMPFPHPMSLTNDEVYSIVAYLLQQNEIQIEGKDIEDDMILDKKTLMKVVMPNVDGFYPDVNGKDGPLVMKKFLSNPANYGTPTERCMKNCPTGQVVHIKNALDDGIKPPVSQVRDLPKEKPSKNGGDSKFAKLFADNCKACHGNKAIAPVPGDKEAWAERIKQGKETLYEHALKGFQGMPPKGGHMELDDATIKGIVDYMVEQSK